MQDNQQRPATSANSPEVWLAERVKARRKALGWSQAKLAQAVSGAGVKLDSTAITRLERGERGIALNEAVALATVLQVELVELAGLDPGDLSEQAERAQASLTQAFYAEAFWRAEVAARRARLEDLVTQQEEARGNLVTIFGELMKAVAQEEGDRGKPGEAP